MAIEVKKTAVAEAGVGVKGTGRGKREEGEGEERKEEQLNLKPGKTLYVFSVVSPDPWQLDVYRSRLRWACHLARN